MENNADTEIEDQEPKVMALGGLGDCGCGGKGKTSLSGLAGGKRKHRRKGYWKCPKGKNPVGKKRRYLKRHCRWVSRYGRKKR